MNVFKDVGTYAFHCHKRHPTEVPPSGARHPSMLPLVFNVPSSFFLQTTPSKSRNVQDHELDIKSRAGKKRVS